MIMVSVTLGVYVQASRDSGERTSLEMGRILGSLKVSSNPVLKMCSESL